MRAACSDTRAGAEALSPYWGRRPETIRARLAPSSFVSRAAQPGVSINVMASSVASLDIAFVIPAFRSALATVGRPLPPAVNEPNPFPNQERKKASL